jgi:hypothetical protein
MTACGPGSEKNNGNNGTVECQSNADCEGGAVCDLSTNTCQGGSANGDTNGTPNGDTNGTPNGDTNGSPNGNTNGAPNGNTNGDPNNTTNNNTTGECGNGIVDANETCDPNYQGTVEEGACPVGEADCTGTDACTTATVDGDPGMCTAMCVYDTITACTDDDGCCPGACDITTDNDCDPKIGQACTSDDDCPATGAGEGFCQTEEDWRWPGGFCSGGCSADADCDDGSYCNGRVCVPDCTDDVDCRTGYECYDYYVTGNTTCAPAQGTAELSGGACTSDDDCLGALFGASCLTDDVYPEGYCISGCQVDADCAAGTHCATLAGGGQACLPDCMDNNDCRTGYECFDWAGDITNTCGPVANGNGEVGDACGVLQDCAGGQEGLCIAENPDWDGGYCSVAECTAGGGECPAGSHCGFIDPTSQEGICLEDCTMTDDCRTNYACVDRDDDGTDECAPSGIGTSEIGDTCAGLYDCNAGLDSICINEDSGWRAGYCTLGCTSDADCGTGYHCAAQDDFTNEGFCMADCTVGNDDCRTDGYACFDWDDDGAGVTECAPAGTGAGVEGDTCAGVWDCDGGPGAFCLPDDQSWPEGYCAIGGCTDNADCIDGHCGFIGMDGEGVCIDSCTDDADCRMGYGCFDLDDDTTDECLPEGDGNVGDPCGSFADCGGRENALCFPDSGNFPFPGGHCSLDCTGADICPVGSTCTDLDVDFSACLNTCMQNADCRPGYTCQDLGGADMVCFPE